MYELNGGENFFHELAAYIEETTVLATYKAMPEESRRKYRERIVITSCKTFAPKKNWDISMAAVREFVGRVLDEMEAQSKEEITDGNTTKA